MLIPNYFPDPKKFRELSSENRILLLRMISKYDEIAEPMSIADQVSANIWNVYDEFYDEPNAVY